MEQEELRIGNLILSGKDRTKVHSIGEQGINLYWNYGEMCDHPFILLKGIPLTEEWLKRFGYKQEKFHYTNDSEFTIHRTGVPNLYALQTGDDKGISINEVHQLQNLYYALTGEDLKSSGKL